MTTVIQPPEFWYAEGKLHATPAGVAALRLKPGEYVAETSWLKWAAEEGRRYRRELRAKRARRTR